MKKFIIVALASCLANSVCAQTIVECNASTNVCEERELTDKEKEIKVIEQQEQLAKETASKPKQVVTREDIANIFANCTTLACLKTEFQNLRNK